MGDTKIKYDIEAAVTGQADINSLSDRLEALSNTVGADLAPATKAAAAEMRALGQQQAAILAFMQLSEQVKKSEQDLALAQKAAKSFITEISASGPPTAQQAATLARLNTEVQQSQTKLNGQKESISLANQELLKYGLTGDRVIEAQRRTAAAVDTLKTSVQASIPAFKTVGDEGAASALKIGSAWQTLGVKSFAQTQVEIARVKAALDTVKASGASPIEIKVATAAAQSKIAELETGVKQTATATTGLGTLLQTLGPLIATTFGAQQFIGAITSAESLNRSYEQIFGSTSKARQEMEFVKVTANKLGLETLDLAKAYQSLAAATRGTTLEGKATRDVFESVTRAMGVMGKSSEETKNALNAISQMSSKGVVAMEELRGQLGEALPGALKATADGAGITTQELVDMVSSGNMLAKDMIPALTAGLNKLYANAPPPQTVISEWARFKNEIIATETAIGEGGANGGLAAALRIVAQEIHKDVAEYGVFVGALTAGKNILTGQTLAQELSAAALKKLGVEQNLTTEITLGGTKAIIDNTSAAQANFRQQELRAQGIEDNAVKSAVAYDKLNKNIAAYIAQVAQETLARDAESKILTQLVSLYGTEAEKLQVASQAAQTNAEMSVKLTAAKSAELTIAQSHLKYLQDTAAAQKDETAETAKLIVEAQKKVDLLQAEFEKTDAVAKAKQIDVVATQAQALAYQDNSGKLAEYAASLKVAEFEVAQLTKEHAEGKASDEELTAARKNLAGITILYKDAVGDVVTKLQAKQIADKANATVTEIALNAQKTYYKAMEDSAKAAGDYNLALYASIEQKKIDIKIIEAHVAAMNVEAAGAIAVAKAQLAVLDASGKVDPVQRAQIEASIKIAEAKIKEADALGLSTEAIQREIDKLKNGADANRNFTDATNGVTAALERKNAAMEKDIAAQEKQLDLAKRQKALDDAKRGVDAEGFALNTAGQRVQSSFDLKTTKDVYDMAIQGGASATDAQTLANKFGTADIPGVTKRARDSGNQSHIQPFDALKFNQALSDLVMSRRSTGNTGDQSGAGSQSGGGKTYNVNITWSGVSHQYSATSDADAQALIKLLQNAKLSSGL